MRCLAAGAGSAAINLLRRSACRRGCWLGHLGYGASACPRPAFDEHATGGGGEDEDDRHQDRRAHGLHETVREDLASKPGCRMAGADLHPAFGSTLEAGQQMLPRGGREMRRSLLDLGGKTGKQSIL